MVREMIKGDKRIFICEECGLEYLEINVAQKCEDYCSKHYACSLEITKNAVYKLKQPWKP